MAKKKEENTEYTEVAETTKNVETVSVYEMTLKEKLHAIQSSIRAVMKDTRSGKEDDSFSYEYVSGNKILGYIRPLMDKYGVLLIPDVCEIENKELKYSVYNKWQKANVEKFEIMTTVKIIFNWVNVHRDETLSCTFFANGANGFEKGLGSALTYAERYFLLKFFHIATDEDDVDNSERKSGEDETTIKPVPPKSEAESTGKTLPDQKKPKVLDTVPIPEVDRATLIQMISVKIDKTGADYYKILKYFGLKESDTLANLDDENLKKCAEKTKVWEDFVEYKKGKKGE